jgi:hypothetical protein
LNVKKPEDRKKDNDDLLRRLKQGRVPIPNGSKNNLSSGMKRVKKDPKLMARVFSPSTGVVPSLPVRRLAADLAKLGRISREDLERRCAAQHLTAGERAQLEDLLGEAGVVIC